MLSKACKYFFSKCQQLVLSSTAWPFYLGPLPSLVRYCKYRGPRFWEVSQASFGSTSNIFLRNGFPKNDQMADFIEGTAPNNVRVYTLHAVISFRAWLAPWWKNILGLQLYWHFSFPELRLEWGLELLLVSGLYWSHALRPDSFNCGSLKMLSTEDFVSY